MEYITTETMIKVIKGDTFMKGKGIEIVGGIRRNFTTLYIQETSNKAYRKK